MQALGYTQAGKRFVELRRSRRLQRDRDEYDALTESERPSWAGCHILFDGCMGQNGTNWAPRGDVCCYCEEWVRIEAQSELLGLADLMHEQHSAPRDIVVLLCAFVCEPERQKCGRCEDGHGTVAYILLEDLYDDEYYVHVCSECHGYLLDNQ